MVFAIDDSEIQIEGRPHTILGAIGVRDPSTVESALNKLKAEFGLTPADEVKWNGMPPMPQQDREALSQDQRRYLQYLQTLSPSPVASATVRSVVSHQSGVIQLADVLAGFNRLATEIALGRVNKQLIIRDGGPDYDVETTLLDYISSSLRWAMWGHVPPPPDPSNVTFDATWPFKRDGGHGFRIHSTISPLTIEQIYDSGVVYMGCMH